jgi:hypothetical protein
MVWLRMWDIGRPPVWSFRSTAASIFIILFVCAVRKLCLLAWLKCLDPRFADEFAVPLLHCFEGFSHILLDLDSLIHPEVDLSLRTAVDRHNLICITRFVVQTPNNSGRRGPRPMLAMGCYILLQRSSPFTTTWRGQSAFWASGIRVGNGRCPRST